MPATRTPADPQHCFPPIAGASVRVLILGSFPGAMSLERQQYYAHPRNSFWKIMTSLLSGEPGHDYRQRVGMLKNNHIALWDVLHSCRRPGSLDSAIESASVITNDFDWFFSRHEAVRAIFFNGTMAHTSFARQVLPQLRHDISAIARIRLPSTSPAMATLTLEQKVSAWQVVKDYL